MEAHPGFIADITFDAAAVRAYIRETLAITRGCVVEMSLKDTHTCNHQPERFDAWTRIAMEEASAPPASIGSRPGPGGSVGPTGPGQQHAPLLQVSLVSCVGLIPALRQASLDHRLAHGAIRLVDMQAIGETAATA